MESMAAMMVVLFQLFFGWCGAGESERVPVDNCAVSQH